MSECNRCSERPCVCQREGLGPYNDPQTVDPGQVFVNREALAQFVGVDPYRQRPQTPSPHLFTSDDEYWDLDAIVHAWWFGDSLRVIFFAGPRSSDTGASARANGKAADELWEALKMYKGSK